MTQPTAANPTPSKFEEPFFDPRFRSLTGFTPMRWQRRLFKCFVEAGLPNTQDIPGVCDIPTGLGKTSIIIIWLLALVQQAEGKEVRLPRRLVYVVNRRTVVDQATRTVERLRLRLLEPDRPEWEEHADTLRSIDRVLGGLCASDGMSLGVSTLRGELADNEEWKADPARPAIIVGTIDMIGSKLLFSGYGDGRYGRTHHGGLIGHDALIIHDEAHLTPAFSDLLHAVAREQGREADKTLTARPLRVVELSATRREADGKPFTLEAEDRDDLVVQERMTSTKRLRLHPVPAGSVADKIVELSTRHEAAPCKVLIYLRTPAHSQQVASALAKALDGERVALLTGTIRGHERDALVERNLVYRALLDPELDVAKSVYLVSTSAGEVGIDLDADHLVCDLTTLDALIQRLGRVNRRGGKERTANVDVVVEDENEKKEKQSEIDCAIAGTRALLEQWRKSAPNADVNVGPQALRELLDEVGREAIKNAFSPRAAAPLLTDILLDTWSLTSIDRIPGRVEVAPFLHGLTSDPPETHVAWRREVSILHEAGVDEASLGDWCLACRIEAREKLRDRHDRVKKMLTALLGSLREEDSSLDFPVVLLDERGRATWSRLSSLAAKDVNLAYLTVILPVAAGGLNRNGTLDSEAAAASGLQLDVAEHDPADRQRERWLHRSSSDGDRYERLVSGELADALPEDLREKERVSLRRAGEGGEAETVDLILLVSPAESALENPETTSARQTLDEHTRSIVTHMARIADRLDIKDPVRTALLEGARWHDKGKDRAVWQRYARNGGRTEVLAKATSYLHPRALGGYRHEFGSLLDAMNDPDIRKLPDRELVLHLIAAHHGWARPHFEPRSFDNSYKTAANIRAFSDVVRRFGQLQQSYGRWTLAWLESLVRCADIASSQEAVGSAKNPSMQEGNR
jgi:CRISPR-associated endonuclease/helicase Cas3